MTVKKYEFADKLRHLPHILYTNVKSQTNRKHWMEYHFRIYGMSFTRIEQPPASELPKDFYKQLDGDYEESSLMINWYSSQILDLLRKWLDDTKGTGEPYIILMEDDYDVRISDYWHFSWDYMMEQLPYGWDCIQLGFESPDVVPFYLHPTKPEYSLGATLMSRHYAEKLLDLHYINGKYKFDNVIANSVYMNRDSGIHDGMTFEGTSGSPDYFLAQSGNCYSLPLIPIVPYFTGISDAGVNGMDTIDDSKWKPRPSFLKCYKAYWEWWTQDRDNFTSDEFFSYGKDNDNLMERNISQWSDQYFIEQASNQRSEFLNRFGLVLNNHGIQGS
tara:strand:- start:2352 stop:3344 length:993 start_codon:yes stop_codon:yes gene_type:complete